MLVEQGDMDDGSEATRLVEARPRRRGRGTASLWSEDFWREPRAFGWRGLSFIHFQAKTRKLGLVFGLSA
jgi:hypothetical protein